MNVNYTAVLFLLAAFGGAYLMRYYKCRCDFVWLVLATLCTASYVTLMLMGGSSLFDTALGIAVLSAAVFIIDKREDKTLAV